MKSFTKYHKFIVAVIAYIIFYDFVNGAYNNYIIRPILSKATSSYFADITIISIAIFSIYSFIRLCQKKFYITLETSLICLLILVTYSINRFLYPEKFLSFVLSDSIKYFDVLFLLLIFPISLTILGFFSKSQVPKNISKLLDEAIEAPEKDLLRRNSLVIKLEQDITEDKGNEQALAFGVVGKWGVGKTSFVNLLKKKIKNNQNFIIIDFNPWLSSSKDLIIKDFFNTIGGELGKYSFGIKGIIREYGKSFLSPISNKYLMGNLFDDIFLDKHKSLKEEYKNIDKLLKQLNKKILIFIDDLDRLKSDEIFEILKLIRNTASFSSFTYVVCYDKDYVSNAILNNDIPNSNLYLDKIFLKEYKLLELTAEEIHLLTKEFLIEFSGAKKNEIQDFFGNIYKRVFIGITQENILPLNNIRDIKRFISTFIPSYQSIDTEVEFSDFLVLQLIKFKFYNIYNLLFFQKEMFLTTGSDYYNQPYYQQRYKYRLADKKEDKFQTNEFKHSVIKKYIENNFNFSEIELEQIKWLLEQLFRYPNKEKRKGISFPDKYYLYFKEELKDSDISTLHFEELITLPFSQLKEEILKLNTEGLLDSFLIKIYEKTNLSFSSRGEFETYVRILFYIGNLIHNTTIKKSIGVDLEFLINLLVENKNSIRDRLYNSKDEFKIFFLSLLKDATFPFTFQMKFCNRVLLSAPDTFDERHPISRENIINYMITYFDKHTEQMLSVESDFWNLWRYSKVTEWKERSGYKNFIPEIVHTFKEKVFPKFIDEFLVYFVTSQPFYGDSSEDYSVGINKLPLDIWKNWNAFICNLESDELKNKLTRLGVHSEFLFEFTEFAKEVIEKEKYIRYNFTYPPIVNKLKELERRNNK